MATQHATQDARRPLLIVVSAPSGAGKTTLCDRLLDVCETMTYSVSCTTRAPRGQEQDGVDYHFMDDAEFDRLVADDALLEHAVVHGFKYGTLKKTVEEALQAGRSLLMDIDVAGAAQIREHVQSLPADAVIRKGFLDIFIAPPSMDVLRARLEGRGEDSSEVIGRRMENAKAEMARAGEYAYTVVNDDLDRAYEELRGIVEAAGQDTGRE